MEGSRRGEKGKNSEKQYYIEHKQKAAGELGMTLAKHKKVHWRYFSQKYRCHK